jgi:hypothetical protein
MDKRLLLTSRSCKVASSVGLHRCVCLARVRASVRVLGVLACTADEMEQRLGLGLGRDGGGCDVRSRCEWRWRRRRRTRGTVGGQWLYDSGSSPPLRVVGDHTRACSLLHFFAARLRFCHWQLEILLRLGQACGLTWLTALRQTCIHVCWCVGTASRQGFESITAGHVDRDERHG